MITILVSYKQGTGDMLNVCVESLLRHTNLNGVAIRVVCSGEFDSFDVVCGKPVEFVRYPEFPHVNGTGSQKHAFLLDHAVKDVKTPLVMTLDSDCFPVADGWLHKLTGMIGQGYKVVGILHPWIPPPDCLSKNTIEHRLRRGLNWTNTRVACQMCRTEFILENNIGFLDGDDTGWSIPALAKEMGLEVGGYMPTRCAMPDIIEGEQNPFDPEVNRDCCVVYGDMVYHHGGASRKSECFFPWQEHFKGARSLVMMSGGAEFILEHGHEYRFDDEEKVAEEKMKITRAMILGYLETHDCLFKKERT